MATFIALFTCRDGNLVIFPGVLTWHVAGKLVAKSLVQARMKMALNSVLSKIKRRFGTIRIPDLLAAVVLVEGGDLDVTVVVVVTWMEETTVMRPPTMPSCQRRNLISSWIVSSTTRYPIRTCRTKF